MVPWVVRAAGLALGFGRWLAAAQQGGGQQQQQQKIPAPKWLNEEGTELFYDVEQEEEHLSSNACEWREKLLKLMMGKGDQDAGAHRSRVLHHLGLCEMKKKNWVKARKHILSSISELNFDEASMMKNENLAHLPLLRQATEFMDKGELTQAGTAARRCREILERQAKKNDQVHAQAGSRRSETAC